MNINQLLQVAVTKKASDLHLSEGLPPYFRIDGDLVIFKDAILNNQPLIELLAEIMTATQIEQFKSHLELDFALSLPNIGRFRANVFKQDNGVGIALRVIPERILSLDELGLPNVFQHIAEFPHGLVLLTGPTGSGKTTTLAAVIDYINKQRAEHIVTIEDPIEYLHKDIRSRINQREVHRDTKSFNAALRSALREDPDIILVGELRDLETIRLALTAAETGHLVFATLHTSSAAKTINRISDVFPAGEKNLVRNILSESLQAVIAQTLLKKNGGGRVAALEVMMCTPAIRNLIREDKIAQIYSAMQTGAVTGMQTLDQHLRALMSTNIISRDSAKEAANTKDFF